MAVALALAAAGAATCRHRGRPGRLAGCGLPSQRGGSRAVVDRCGVANNGGRSHYRAYGAHRRAARCARRPKVAKLAARPALRKTVENLLEELRSPEQTANWLRQEHPDDPMTWVSHETIYQSLLVQGRGVLKRELVKCLRTGRAERRPRSRSSTGRHSRVPGMVMISERPAEVADRAVPGH
jgi:IS30 family transposase